MQGKRSTYLLHAVPMEAPGGYVPGCSPGAYRAGNPSHRHHLHTLVGRSVIIILQHTLVDSRVRHVDQLQGTITDRMKRRKAGVLGSYTLGRIAKIAREGKRYPWGGMGRLVLGLDRAQEGLHKRPRNVSPQIKHVVHGATSNFERENGE